MGDLYLDKETKDILGSLPTRGKSAFVREAIKEKMYGKQEVKDVPPKKQIIPEVEFVE